MSTLALAAIFVSVSHTLSLPQGLLSAVCYTESKHNIHAINRNDGNSDSMGACQLKLETARYLGYSGSKEKLMDKNTNIYWSGRYLQYQLLRYDDVISAISAYNVGKYRTKDGKPVNLNYVRKVLNAWAEHR